MNFEQTLEQWLDRAGDWAITTGLHILVILIVMVIALIIARVFSTKIFAPFKSSAADKLEMQKRYTTLSSLVRYVLSVVIFVISTIMILGELGIEIGPILAAAGVVGLAVGFGAQNIVQDVFSGFFIILEDQIRVDDVVQIAGKGGLVEKVNLRMIILRDLAGNVHFIRNGKIDIVTNMTKEYSRYVFDIGVAYRENVDEVIAVIKEVDAELRTDSEYGPDILEEIEILGLDKFDNSAVVIKARTKTKPIKQWRVAREFNRRLKIAFDARDIEIPFPHMTVYMGQDKNGQAPPLRVAIPSAEQPEDPRGGGQNAAS